MASAAFVPYIPPRHKGFRMYAIEAFSPIVIDDTGRPRDAVPVRFYPPTTPTVQIDGRWRDVTPLDLTTFWSVDAPGIGWRSAHPFVAVNADTVVWDGRPRDVLPVYLSGGGDPYLMWSDNFVTGEYRFNRVKYAAITDLPLTTFTRPSTGWAFDQQGVLQSYTPGVPMINLAGLAIYDARTNYLRNPVMTGGGPGALPNNWVITNASGLTTTPLGVGVSQGLPYVDLRLQAVGGAGGTYILVMDSVFPAVTVGQSWTLSGYAALLAGTFTNLGAARFVAEEFNGVTPVGNSAGVIALTSVLAQGVAVRTIISGNSIASEFRLNVSAGDVDATIRIAAPNLKLGDNIGDPPILQNTNAPATRNADLLIQGINIPVAQDFTIFGKFIAPPLVAMSGGSNFPSIFAFDNGVAPGTDRLIAFCSGGSAFGLNGASQGVSSGGVASLPGVITPGAVTGFAISVSGAALQISINGAAPVAAALPGGPFGAAITRLFHGSTNSPASRLNSVIRNLGISLRAFSAAELRAASDVSLLWDENFTSQLYYYAGDLYPTVTDLPLTTFSRPTAGWAFNTAGSLLAYAAGVPMINNAGLAIFPSRTNSIRNPTGLGVVPGSPGVSPLNWSLTWNSSGNGLAKTILGARTVDGVPGIDVRFTGTPADNNEAALFYGDAAIPASDGQTWTATWDAYLIEGFGISSASMRIAASGGSGNIVPVVLTGARQTFRNERTFGVTTSARGYLRLDVAQGVPVDFTVWVGAPQLKQGVDAGDPPILQTSNTSANRAADSFATSENNPVPFTVLAEVAIPLVGLPFAYVWSWNDNTNNNFAGLYYDRAASKLVLQVNAAGVGVATLDLGAAAPGTAHKVAARIAGNDFAASKDGAACVTDLSGAVPSATTFWRGRSHLTSTEWGAGLCRLVRYSVGLTNAQLQALST